MKIIDDIGIDAVVEAITNDPYSSAGADDTASKLTEPGQIRYLTKLHADELEENASDRIWSLLGQAVHVILERAAGKDEIAEKRYASQFAGWTVSGQFDNLDLRDGTLRDFKVTSAYSIVFQSRYADWRAQLNTLAELAIRAGHDVRAIEVVAILRDWQESKSLADSKKPDDEKGKYPQRQIVRVPLELWPIEKRVAWIEERVRIHQRAEAGDYEPCSDSERWMKDPKWALMKSGRKSAVKLYDAEAEAFTALGLQPAGSPFYVERRPGEYSRCAGYCPVGGDTNLCKQWVADRERLNEKDSAA